MCIIWAGVWTRLCETDSISCVDLLVNGTTNQRLQHVHMQPFSSGSASDWRGLPGEKGAYPCHPLIACATPLGCTNTATDCCCRGFVLHAVCIYRERHLPEIGVASHASLPCGRCRQCGRTCADSATASGLTTAAVADGRSAGAHVTCRIFNPGGGVFVELVVHM